MTRLTIEVARCDECGSPLYDHPLPGNVCAACWATFEEKEEDAGWSVPTVKEITGGLVLAVLGYWIAVAILLF